MSLECKPLKGKVFSASVNAILGADSGTKYAGAIAALASGDRKGPGMHRLGLEKQTWFQMPVLVRAA